MGSKGTACVTGASSGIGEVFARRLGTLGYDLILHGRRKERLEQLGDELQRRNGVRAEPFIADLDRPDELRSLESKLRTTPDLRFLVNNAGYSSIGRFHNEDIDGQEAIIHTHVVASVRLTHAALPAMLAAREGRIINVSSVAGFLVAPGSVTYCATKAYMISFSESLHLEVAPRGIKVQALCPGYTRSEFHQRLGYDTSGDFFRNFMTAEEVVDRSLKDLERGRVISIPGLQFKAVALAPRFLPRRFFYWTVLATERFRRRQFHTK